MNVKEKEPIEMSKDPDLRKDPKVEKKHFMFLIFYKGFDVVMQ